MLATEHVRCIQRVTARTGSRHFPRGYHGRMSDKELCLRLVQAILARDEVLSWPQSGGGVGIQPGVEVGPLTWRRLRVSFRPRGVSIRSLQSKTTMGLSKC